MAKLSECVLCWLDVLAGGLKIAVWATDKTSCSLTREMATPSASGAGTGGSAMASAPAPAAPAAAPTATLPAGTPTSSPPTVVTATISARERHAEARIGADEWDVDAWHALLGEAALKPYSESEPLYKRICGQFPSHGRFWIERAQHCARSGGDSATVTSVYEEGVAATPTCVELWRGYLSYAASHATAGNTNSVLGIFERAVDAAGLDLHATNLWNDYIEYLRSRAVLADSQRRDALRRVYQRAVRDAILLVNTSPTMMTNQHMLACLLAVSFRTHTQNSIH